MAQKKPLVLGSDGTIEQLQAGDTLDVTMPSGGDVVTLTMAEAVVAGDVVCINSTGAVKADKDDPTKVGVVGFATAAGNIGDPIEVRVAAAQGGLSGLTAGDKIFLDLTGGISQTVPTSGYAVKMGVALSATDALVEVTQPIKL